MANPKRTGPRGAGRPPMAIPDGWKAVVMAMAKDGKHVDQIRAVLKSNGHNVAKAGIAKFIASQFDDLTKIANGVTHHAALARGLESPEFEEFREVVDDFILDERSPVRIRAYLHAEGFDIPIDMLVDYCNRRKAELDKRFAESASSAPRDQVEHTKTLRRRLTDIWHRLPTSERYTARMFGLVLAEYGQSLRFNIEQLKESLEGKDPQAANEEIERKLGLVESDEPAQETAAPNDTRPEEPSGAEAPTGATV